MRSGTNRFSYSRGVKSLMIQNTYMVQETESLTAEKRRELFIENCNLYTELTGKPIKVSDFDAMYVAEDHMLILYNLILRSKFI